MKMFKTRNLETEILSIIGSDVRGQSIVALASALNLNAEDFNIRRKLQRTLKLLITKKKVKAVGNARARLYVLASLVSAKQAPLTSRKPVGYNESFLQDYIPNKSKYLTLAQVQELHKLGKVESTLKVAGTYAKDIFQRLTVDLSWNSSRLEGNTYSFLETKRLIDLGETAEGKSAAEAQMILNHKAAIEFLVSSAEDIEFDKITICNIHALLSDNLLGDPSASGKIRDRPVQISGSSYMPIENPYFLAEMFDLFLSKVRQIKDPFEQSFFALVHLSYLQAFEDVNKRTSRISANIPLVKRNLKPLAFVDVEQDKYLSGLLNIYENNDVSHMGELFVWAYERSSQRYSAIQQSMGEPNLLKLKYRDQIHNVIQKVIKSQTPGQKIHTQLKNLVSKLNLNSEESRKILEILEVEITSLHEGNIARYQIRPSEFKAWLKLTKS